MRQQQQIHSQKTVEQQGRHHIEQLERARYGVVQRQIYTLHGRAAEWINSLYLKSLNIIHTIKHHLGFEVVPTEEEHIITPDPHPPITPTDATRHNHALQEYQMQLMLLEQQNKKRLLMAMQEKEVMGGGPRMLSGGTGSFVPMPEGVVSGGREDVEDGGDGEEGYQSPDGTFAEKSVDDHAGKEDEIQEL